MGTGVASFVLLLFLLPSRWENAARASEDCQRFGQRKDCDQYDAPTAKERVCRIHSTPSGSELEWYTGTLDGELERCMGILRARDVSKFCPGYVGMSMSLLCDFANVTAVLYKDGEPLTEEANVTFSGLQKEDEGLYQCRQRGSLDLIAEFNMTVQSKTLTRDAHIHLYTNTHTHTIL